MYKISKENLKALFRLIAAEQELYVPVKTADQVNFAAWSEEAETESSEAETEETEETETE